jgi:acetoin utilization deacetylase AcuC-like enzyme
VFVSHLLRRHGRIPFIVDVDYHAGDGTAASLAPDAHNPESPGSSDCAKAMVSLHAPSDYPFLPTHLPWAIDVPPSADWPVFEALLREALRRRPETCDVLVISLGFDTLAGDPDAREGHRFELQPADFAAMRRVLDECHVPLLAVQEGGYHLADIPAAAEAFCTGQAC